MTIDWTVSLGNILTGLAMIIGAAGIIYELRGNVKALAARITLIEVHMLKITDVLVHIGRQDERLNSHEKRIDRMEDITK